MQHFPLKKGWVITIAIILTCQNSLLAQLTIQELKKYLTYDYDKLDAVLSIKGYKYLGEKTTDDRSINYLWGRKADCIVLAYTPDTVTIINNKTYLGYTDVIKTSTRYVTSNEVSYRNLERAVKGIPELVKQKSIIRPRAITTTYNGVHYNITCNISTDNGEIMYGVFVESRGYEIRGAHLE